MFHYRLPDLQKVADKLPESILNEKPITNYITSRSWTIYAIKNEYSQCEYYSLKDHLRLKGRDLKDCYIAFPQAIKEQLDNYLTYNNKEAPIFH